jgi:hypothetical protein
MKVKHLGPFDNVDMGEGGAGGSPLHKVLAKY